jgi:Ca2+-binding RTX toxin-like protein
MLGGAGSDTYFVDNTNDSVVENASEGSDVVLSTANYALSANVEALVLLGTADLQGYGNSQNNVIYGNVGNNLLNGGAGVDLMVGGAGNDTYFADDSSDSAFEIARGRQRRRILDRPLWTGRGCRDAHPPGQRRPARLRQQSGEHDLRQCRQQPA